MTLDIKQVFATLRRNELAGQTDDLELLDALRSAIATREEFILGSFVYSEPGSDASHFWPRSSPPLFYHNSYSNDVNFTEKAKATFDILTSKNLFLSAMLHELDEKRAKRVELIHSDDATTCFSEGHESGCSSEFSNDSAAWAINSTLGKLPHLFRDDASKASASAYSAEICGYFPNQDSYLIVYCPFLVPDGKPPGNFFGVFRCQKRCSQLLEFLSDIQLAGTLIFSRMAVDAKLEKLNLEVKKLHEYHDAIHGLGAVLGRIETIVNPTYLLAGVGTLSAMRLNDFLALDTPHHNVDSWTKDICLEFVGLLKSKKQEFLKLRRELPEGLYGKLFGGVQGILDDNGELESTTVKDVGRIIKSIFKEEACPLVWISNAEKHGEAIKLSGGVTALGFMLGLRALETDEKNIFIRRTKIDGSVLLEISVLANDEGEDGLNALCGLVRAKATNDAFKLHDRHTATALALLWRASGLVKDPEMDGNVVKFSYSYKLRDIK